MVDSSDYADELRDPESIQFVGDPESCAGELLDFNKPMWLVEIYYSSNVTQHLVNAADRREALNDVLQKAAAEGERVMTFDHIVVTKLVAIESFGFGGEQIGP